MNHTHGALLDKKNNRFHFSILFVLIFIFMWILFGGNTANADYLNYKNVYDLLNQYGDYSAIEVGFRFLCKLGNRIGLNYNQFLAVFSFIGLSLIASTVHKYTNKISAVFCLYFIYPFLLDIVQIRNFMAMAIIIFGIRYLIDNNKRGVIKYILCVLLASTFHNTAFFYLIFAFVKIKDYKKIITITSFAIIIGIFIYNFYPTLITKIVASERYTSYLSLNTKAYTKVLFLLYFLFNIVLIYYFYRVIKKNGTDTQNNTNDNQITFADVIMKVNILVTVSYVFLLYDVDFVRLFRNILILNYLLFEIAKTKIKITKSVSALVYSVMFLVFIVLSSWAFIFFTNYYGVVYPIIHNNSIFNFNN